MSARMAARIAGTKSQHDALALQAMATKIIALKQNTSLNTEQRLQVIRFLSTR